MIILGKSSKYNADFVSPLFEPKYFSIYRVVFYFSEKAFLLAILNPMGEIMLIKTYTNMNTYSIPDFLGKICFEDELIKSKFASWEVILNSKKWTIVPAEFLSDGGEIKYLEALFRINNDEECQRNFVKPLGLNIIYTLDTELVKKLNFYFPDVQIRHSIASSILHYFKSANFQPTEHFAVIELFEDIFNITIFKHGNLIFANQYTFGNADDLLYNVILVNNAIQINEKNLEITLTGISQQYDEIVQTLKEHYPLYRSVPAIYPPQIALEQHGLKIANYAPMIFNYLEHNKKS